MTDCPPHQDAEGGVPARSGPASDKPTDGIDPSAGPAPRADSDRTTLYDALTELVFVVDRSGRLAYANPVSRRRLDHAVGGLIGLPLSALHPAGRRDEVERALRAALAGEPQVHSVPLLTRTGVELAVETHLVPGEWEGDAAVIGLACDLSELNRTADALRESRDRLADIIDGMRAGAWEWNVATGAVVFNERWADIVGYTLDELAPVTIDTWTRLCHPDDLELSDALLARHFSGEFDHYDCECRMLAKDGRWIWVHDRGRVVEWDRKGRPLRMTGTHTDITERKRREQELRLFQAIVEHSSEAITVHDVDGAIVYVNRAHQRLFGLADGDAAATRIDDCLSPAARDVLTNRVRPTLAAGGGWEGELEAVHVTGRRFPVWMRADALHDSNGRVLFGFTLMHNLSDQKDAETRRIDLERTQQQILKAESLARMAGAIAHHFNNKLTGVIGNLELVLSELPTGAIRDETSNALVAAREAARISRMMLATIGQTRGRPGTLNLARACMAAFAACAPSMPATVRIDTSGLRDDTTAVMDAGHLHQVLVTLLVNAREALGSQPGTIRMATGSVAGSDLASARLFPPGWIRGDRPYAFVEIGDTGEGIDAVTMNRIFDPFFSTKFAGRGLGLPVALGLLRPVDGAVAVDSQPGRGAIFRVLLPWREPRLPDEPPTP